MIQDVGVESLTQVHVYKDVLMMFILVSCLKI